MAAEQPIQDARELFSSCTDDAKSAVWLNKDVYFVLIKSPCLQYGRQIDFAVSSVNFLTARRTLAT